MMTQRATGCVRVRKISKACDFFPTRLDFSELSSAPCWAANWGQLAGVEQRQSHSSHEPKTKDQGTQVASGALSVGKTDGERGSDRDHSSQDNNSRDQKREPPFIGDLLYNKDPI